MKCLTISIVSSFNAPCSSCKCDEMSSRGYPDPCWMTELFGRVEMNERHRGRSGTPGCVPSYTIYNLAM
jgi:hypothetical protein